MMKKVIGILFAVTVILVASGLEVNAQSMGYCQPCQREVNWLPLAQDSTQGHFYVAETEQTISTITLKKELCLDLRGSTLKADGQGVFYLVSDADLRIQDTKGGGKIIGSNYGDNTTGGTICIAKNATCHLYSGTLTNALWEGEAPMNGGVIYCIGAFYMHGGVVENGVCSWAGGNIYIASGGQMDMSGGAVTGGKASVLQTDCIFNRGAITVSGDAVIEKLRLLPHNGNPPMADSLTIRGAYTGSVELFVDGITEGTDIGNLVDGGSFLPCSIRLLRSKLLVYSEGADILVGKRPAVIHGENGVEWYTDTVQEAIALCQGTDKCLVLGMENNELNTASQNLHVDLNGFDWAGLTVEEGATLYLKDSSTDDFKEGHGKITSLSGTVKPERGYKIYTDEAGVSAHAYDLKITSAALRPSTGSMYYIGRIYGDSQLKSLVFSYGIVLDVTREPSLATLNKTSKHTSIRYGFDRNFGINSVLLTGIFKDTNSLRNNIRNGEMTVYGRPFVRFLDGQIDFGDTRAFSFRELVELADQKWTEEAVPTDLQEMYLRYQDIMDSWNIPNLKKAVATSAPSPYRVPTPMTMETIDSLPIATADMTEEQLRQLCADFFRMQLTFQWVSESDIGYEIRKRHALIPAGRINGGSPYTANAKSGNLYMTMEFYDQQTGVLRNPGITDQQFIKLIGNHCTYGPFWAWARVINSVTAQWNPNMGLEKYGYIPLGDFSTTGVEEWDGLVESTMIIGNKIGQQAVYEGYAQAQLADCLYTWYEASAVSHMRMAAGNAVVVRNDDGTINGEESYILYMDQGGTWMERNVNGDTVIVQGGLDDKVTFAELFEGGYLAFTFGEFIGTEPVEEGIITSTLDALTTVNLEQLAQATVSSNYPISHVTVSVTDGQGKEVYRGNAFAPRINTMEMGISDGVDAEKLTALAGQHLTVTCRIGNGVNAVLFDGILE